MVRPIRRLQQTTCLRGRLRKARPPIIGAIGCFSVESDHQTARAKAETSYPLERFRFDPIATIVTANKSVAIDKEGAFSAAAKPQPLSVPASAKIGMDSSSMTIANRTAESETTPAIIEDAANLVAR